MGQRGLDEATWQRIYQLAEGGPLLSEVRRLYDESTGTSLTMLRDAARAGDRERVGMALHRLQGAASSVGAMSLAGRCASLGRRLTSGGEGFADGDLAAVEADVDEVRLLVIAATAPR